MTPPLSPVEGHLRHLLHDPHQFPPVPDGDDILRRVARRRRRRSTALASATAVLVIGVVAAAATVMAARPNSLSAPGQPSSSAMSPSTLKFRFPGLTLEQAWFSDAQHGFALVSGCPPSTDANPCGLWLAVTVDSGLTWQPRPVSGTAYAGPTPGMSDGLSTMRVLDASRVLVDTTPPLVTVDGGATWTPQAEPSGTADQIPAGADVKVGLDARRMRLVVRRSDGTAAILAHGPPGTFATVEPYAETSADGSVWISGSDGASGPRHFVSVDRGRSWTEVYPPAEAVGMGQLCTTNGLTAYVVDPMRSRVWRSVDRGAHWTEIALPFTVDSRIWGNMPYQNQADGTLLIGDPEHAATYRLAPGSDQLESLPWDTGLRASRIGAAYLRQVGYDQPGIVTMVAAVDRYQISVDGTKWTDLPFPGK